VDKKNLFKMIFLSASIPSESRDKKYYKTADVIAIRDSIRALATVVIPKSHLVWGGHPSITPLIRYVMKKMDSPIRQHVTLFQSKFFVKIFPKENTYFENFKLTPSKRNKETSLEVMRIEMIKSYDYKAGIFIGGMEGVEEEFDLFRMFHPNSSVYPIASTGAAAKFIYNNIDKPNPRLLNDYAYMELFKFLLKDDIST
jgi:hypothetical protein